MAKDKHDFKDPDAPTGPLVSVRFLIALLLIAAGIVYVVLWTLYLRDLRAFDGKGSEPTPMLPFMKGLDDWNWAIGFGALMIGLAISAHPKTPFGRGRGVVIGMLGCFVVGLLWICTFYVFADKVEKDPSSIFLIGELGQLNLVVGIGFMAVGFTFATRWE